MKVDFTTRLKVHMRDGFLCRFCSAPISPLSEDLTLAIVNEEAELLEDRIATACVACVPVEKVVESVSNLAFDRQQKLEEIARSIAEKGNRRVAALRHSSRDRESVNLRSEFCFEAHENGYSYQQIGRFLGRHHSSIQYLVERHLSATSSTDKSEFEKISTAATKTFRT